MNHESISLRPDKTHLSIAIILGVASTLTSYYYTDSVQTVTDAVLWFILLTVGVYIILSFADTLSNRF